MIQMTLRQELPYHFMRSVPQFEVVHFETLKSVWEKYKDNFKAKSTDTASEKEYKRLMRLRFEWNDEPAAAGLAASGYLVIIVPGSLHTDVHIGLRMLELTGRIVEKYQLKSALVYINFHKMLAKFDKSLGRGQLTICGQLLQQVINELGSFT